MRIVIALGGNALMQRGEPLTADSQRRNAQAAAAALAPIALQHQLIITHGNGPQVGLLALQGSAGQPDAAFPLDVLDAETEGMIGYLIEQELANRLPANRPCATLLTRVEFDPGDPAFSRPDKPIGPLYAEAGARSLAQQRGWHFTRDGAQFRRVVASPRPQRIIGLGVIELLASQGVIVICAGGGGIPTVRQADGSMAGVEAVIDKDLASALLARELHADALLMLTDVDAVYAGWGTPEARAIQHASPDVLRAMAFAPGSMAPKIQAACEFVEHTGEFAGIGQIGDALAILSGEAGTVITPS